MTAIIYRFTKIAKKRKLLSLESHSCPPPCSEWNHSPKPYFRRLKWHYKKVTLRPSIPIITRRIPTLMQVGEGTAPRDIGAVRTILEVIPDQWWGLFRLSQVQMLRFLRSNSKVLGQSSTHMLPGLLRVMSKLSDSFNGGILPILITKSRCCHLEGCACQRDLLGPGEATHDQLHPKRATLFRDDSPLTLETLKGW